MFGAVPKPEDIPRLALSRIVAALDDHIDTIELRNLPFTYQRLVAAEPTGRLARVFGLEPAADSLEVIGRLTPILEVLDARLVLIVQDVERLGKGFDTRHLERLLWALRQVERASFILALDPGHSPLDYSKLCDTIELVPSVEARHARTVLKVAYDHWTTDFSYIDPHQNRPEGGKLGLATAPEDGMPAYISRAGGNPPLDAMVSLLRAPRALKHVLRRVDHAWQKLHGEADLDDIMIVAALRHGAEPAYKFLIGSIDAARHDPNDMLPRTTTVKEEWKRRKKRISNRRAVQRLVDLLGIKQLTDEPTIYGTSSPQGVHVNEPTDYFRRIAAEDLGSTELRDQVVLCDIERWRATREGDLVQKLVAASERTEQYARVWRHFSAIHSDTDDSDTELMELTEAVVTSVLERDGSEAAGDHPAIIALWVACGRRLQRGQFNDWVQDLILRAVPISLNLVNDLYYYWTGRHGVVPEAQRGTIRRAIVEAVRELVRTGRDLTRLLATQHPYTVMRLVTQTDVDSSVSAYEVWRDYLPPLLIDGAKHDPETIISELANLAGDEQSGYRAVGPQYPPVFVRRYKIDRERMTVLFGERLDEVLSLLAEYDGNNAYAKRAKDDARSWIEERGSQDVSE